MKMVLFVVNGFVYKTKDGGGNWIDISPQIDRIIIEIYRNDLIKNQEPDGIFAAYYDMYFLNTQEGYVSGFQRMWTLS
jgi:hypothetical protein